MNSDRDILRSTYDRRASWFDGFVRWASLGRDRRYREAAVVALALRPGDRVLDLGCGTGLNLPLLAEGVGEKGRVVGVDLSGGMLRRARGRGIGPIGPIRPILLQADGSRFYLRPGSLDAVLSTYTLTTLPRWPNVLDGLLAALKPGGRIAILDDRLPPGWFINPAFMLKMTRREGWGGRVTAIVSSLEKSCGDVRIENFHGGLIYLASGTCRGEIPTAKSQIPTKSQLPNSNNDGGRGPNP